MELRHPLARVGISGWRYPSWRGDFYPRGLPQRRELGYAAERLDSVEINGSFYSLQRPPSYQRWRSEVPEGFVFAVKGGRFITHMKRLREIETPLANFFASGVLALGPTLGPLLWQLPERLAFDADLLEGFLTRLPRSTAEALELARRHDARLDGRDWLEIETDAPLRHCLEVRHPSYADPSFPALLERQNVGTVVADTAGRWPLFDAVTSDFVYVRLHGGEELYTSGYDDAALDHWAQRATGWLDGSSTPDGRGRDVFVYFDNDARGYAPHDAVRLRDRLADWTGTDAS
jgi:uncharacterized protein YecE (DUF72 family)